MSTPIDGWKCWINGTARIAQRGTHRVQFYGGQLRVRLTNAVSATNVPWLVLRWLMQIEET